MGAGTSFAEDDMTYNQDSAGVDNVNVKIEAYLEKVSEKSRPHLAILEYTL